MKRRHLLLGLIASVLLLILWAMAPSKSEKLVSKAHRALGNGDTLGAETTLAQLKNCRSTAPVSLYLAYLEHARGNYALSNTYLNDALLLKPTPPLSDIHHLRAANAFLQHDDDTFLSLIPLRENGMLATVFKALKSYLLEDYPKALSQFEEILCSSHQKKEKKLWHSTLLAKRFSPLFIRLKQGHCLIELEEFERGRSLIETELHQISSSLNPNTQALGSIFLGLSYLKESLHHSFDKRDSFYKLAHFYFESVSSKRAYFPREMERACAAVFAEAKQIVQHALPAIAPETNSHIVDSLFGFIHLLEEWEASEPLQQIANLMGEHFLEALQAHDPLATLYCQIVESTPLFTEHFTQCVQRELFRTLSNHQFEQFGTLWEVLAAHQSPSLELKQKVANVLLNLLPSVIVKDDRQLTNTHLALLTWQRLETSDLKRENLGFALGNFSKRLWERVGSEPKAINLMQTALTLAPLPKLRHDFEHFLRGLYQAAENANTRARMCLILDAFEILNVKPNALVSIGKVKNTLADCQYLLTSKQYPMAEVHASWVLRIEPKNQKALTLLGLALFYQGNYDKALVSLSQLHSPEAHAKQALILCKAFQQRSKAPHLATADIFEGE